MGIGLSLIWLYVSGGCNIISPPSTKFEYPHLAPRRSTDSYHCPLYQRLPVKKPSFSSATVPAVISTARVTFPNGSQRTMINTITRSQTLNVSARSTWPFNP